jgi:hypothetical protein
LHTVLPGWWQWQVAGSCEHRNESLSSIQCREFVEYPWNNLLLEDSATWSSVAPPNAPSYRPSTLLIQPFWHGPIIVSSSQHVNIDHCAQTLQFLSTG